MKMVNGNYGYVVCSNRSVDGNMDDDDGKRLGIDGIGNDGHMMKI